MDAGGVGGFGGQSTVRRGGSRALYQEGKGVPRGKSLIASAGAEAKMTS